MNTKTVGELTEAKVLVKLLESGYVCSKPFGDNARYDLIVDDGVILQKVQIKTGRVRNGAIEFNVMSCSRYVNKHYKGQVDCFIVYVPELNKYYLVPEDEVGTSKFYLTLSKGNSRSHFAEKYEM